jgi:hypothetical protein
MTSRGLAALSADVAIETDMRGLPSKGRPSVAFTPRIVSQTEHLSDATSLLKLATSGAYP